MKFDKQIKIAIARRNGIGDLICTIPLLNSLKYYYKNCFITLYLSESNHKLYPYIKSADEVITFPRGNKYLSVVIEAIKGRKKKFDISISAKIGSMKLMNIFLYILGAKKKIAYVDSKKWHSNLINHGIYFDENEIKNNHQALNCLRLFLQKEKDIPDEFLPRLYIPDEKRYRYEKKLLSMIYKDSQKSDDKILFVSVSNNRKNSRLKTKVYSDIINSLENIKRFTVIISCTMSDIKIAKELDNSINLTSVIIPTKELDELIVLLSLVDVALLTDGGLMHLAAALCISQVTLFGFTSLKMWRPLTDSAKCLWHHSNVNEIDHVSIRNALIEKLQEIDAS